MLKRFPDSITLLPILVLGLGLAACDSTSADRPLSADTWKSELSNAVQDISLTPLSAKSGKDQYLLTIQFDKSRRSLRFPAGINILSQQEKNANVLIFDDGKGPDLVAEDGIYTGIINEACIPATADTSPRAGKDIEIKCKLEFVGPGESCGAFGECPETLHRSLLWGLIEYDVDTLVCFCLIDCEVTKK